MKNNVLPVLPVSRDMRRSLGFPADYYDKRGRLRLEGPKEARELSLKLGELSNSLPPSAGDLFGAACIITAWRLMLDHFGEQGDAFEIGALKAMAGIMDEDSYREVLSSMAAVHPDDAVWYGRRTPKESAERAAQARDGERRMSGAERAVRGWTLARLAAENPAFAPFKELFTNEPLARDAERSRLAVESYDSSRPSHGPEEAPPLATLRRPMEAAPHSVKDQLLYILTRWGTVLGGRLAGMMGALDLIEEETRPRFGGGPGPVRPPGLGDLDGAARFSDDHEWMPRVVMVAKNILVWLDQLSESYDRRISSLDAIPVEELDVLASRGFNALWLIGLWERSSASREIKRRMGNPEAAASAYSLFGYDIDPALGGWEALERLRAKAAERGIRLSSDMVPNHVGLDSDWVRHHSERLLSVKDCPYPTYTWNGENLSGDSAVDIRLEDHYWDRSDAAVVFRRKDNSTGEERFIYHGNDGTSMPWNDTAQIDFTNPEAREAVIKDILHVARNFPIIRFDAAMVLARKSIRRLWFPEPGAGGSIPSRSEHALGNAAFDEACPAEFWRDVVDRVAAEIPGTLLLAEAFWMMEGYFVRALGMHRVYNSAFMNMLRDGKNSEYLAMMKETMAFDPGILQRYVNFMNNPDEETAVEQFGKDDRYFAVCTLLATLPGLPMFGHGQVEGLSEKYGMEYTKAYKAESPDTELIARHEREIFPLVHRRSLFAGAASFRLYDLMGDGGINENVYAYTNTDGGEKALIVVNNAFERAAGTLKEAAPVSIEGRNTAIENLADALIPSGLANGDWILLKEHLTGLWYLRSAAELRRIGMSIAIDGYGRQLYLEFRYEKETSDGIWKRLAEVLDGSGVPDPDAAAAEIRLRPLKEALTGLFGDTKLETMAKEIQNGRRLKWAADIEKVRRFDTARREMEGSNNSVDCEKAALAMENLMRAAVSYYRLPTGLLRARLNVLFPDNHGSLKDATFLVLRSIVEPLLSFGGPNLSETWERWGMDCLLTSISDNSNELSLMMKSYLSSRDWNKGALKGKAVLQSLLSHPAVREAWGVNSWDGILWFRDESSRSCLRTLIAAEASLPGPSWRRFFHSLPLMRSARQWSKSLEASDYKLNDLLNGAR